MSHFILYYIDSSTTEKYQILVDMLKKKDIYGLAMVIEQILKEGKDCIIRCNEKDRTIEYLREQLKEKDEKISKLYEEIGRIGKIKGKHTAQELECMRGMYEHGASLREIGKWFNADKSTIKRKLIAMGVEIREK